MLFYEYVFPKGHPHHLDFYRRHRHHRHARLLDHSSILTF